MTAIVLPDIDRSTIEELRKRIPDLSEIELPSMERAGKSADEAIDRLLGRSRSPIWPWLAAGIGLVAVLGAVAAWMAWARRPTWQTPTGESWTTSPLAGSDVPPHPDDSSTGGGLTAVEASLETTGDTVGGM